MKKIKKLFMVALLLICLTSLCAACGGQNASVTEPDGTTVELGSADETLTDVKETTEAVTEEVIEPVTEELTTEEVVFNNGYIRIPTKPGLGLDICEEGIARHPYVPVRLRHYNGTLTDIRPKSATKFYFKGIE